MNKARVEDDGHDQHNLSSDAIWYPCPFFNPNSSQEGLLHGFTSPSCEEEQEAGEYFCGSPWNETQLAEETYEGEEYPDFPCGNWFREYGYFSLGNGNCSNEGDSESKGMEYSRQTEGNHESHLRHEEREGTQEGNPWYDLWVACGGKTEAHDYTGQETRVSYSYDVPEIGLCESIFGYWPCLYR